MSRKGRTAENHFDSFDEVTRYVCRYCRREFKTTLRHRCKFNPSFRNCFSCMHCTDIHWIADSGEVLTEQEAKDMGYIGCSKVFSCARCIDEKLHSVTELSAQNWEAGCPMWEMIPAYTGKDSFLLKMWGVHHVNMEGEKK